jgi:SAM-dependent methyltransferase
MQGTDGDPVYQGVSDLEAMASAVNYNHWLFSQAQPFLGQRVLEIGCGIGVYVEYAAQPNKQVLGLEPDPTCLRLARERLAGLDHVTLLQGDICSDETLRQIRMFSPDSAYCFNVLEHIEDDRAALRGIAGLLAEGGYLTLIVPAFPCLYGSNDQLVGHFRRYKKADLSEKLKQTGFSIRRLYYLNSLGFFAWFLLNRVLKQKHQSGGQIGIYDSLLVPMLRRVESRWHPPFGQSLVAVASRK